MISNENRGTIPLDDLPGLENDSAPEPSPSIRTSGCLKPNVYPPQYGAPFSLDLKWIKMTSLSRRGLKKKSQRGRKEEATGN